MSLHKKLTYCKCGKEAEYRSAGYWYEQCHGCWWATDPRHPKNKAEKAHEMMISMQECNQKLREMGIGFKSRKRKP